MSVGKPILALDVGFAHTGYVVARQEIWPWDGDWAFLEIGCIETEQSAKKREVRAADDRARRAAEMYRGIVNVARRHGVVAVLVELPHGGAQSARAASAMAAAAAIAACAVEALGVFHEWYTPDAVKVAACGRKNASKDEVMDAARKRWPDAPWPTTKGRLEHAADAAFVLRAAEGGVAVRLARGMIEPATSPTPGTY